MCGISCTLGVDGHAPAHASPSHNHVNGDTTDSARKKLFHSLDQSLDQIKHRGPDARGHWISQDNRVGTLVNLTCTSSLAHADFLALL